MLDIAPKTFAPADVRREALVAVSLGQPNSASEFGRWTADIWQLVPAFLRKAGSRLR
jgi:hypothetical protein